MSVINDMLKDLDKRQAPEVGAGQSLQQESLIEPQTASVKKLVLIVLVILSLLLAAYFLFWKENNLFPEQEVTLGDTISSKPSGEQIKTIDTSPVSSNEPSKEPVSDKPVHKTVQVPSKNIEESSSQPLEEIQQISLGIKPEPLKESVTSKSSSTDDVKKKQAESDPLVINKTLRKTAISKTEITKSKNIILEADNLSTKDKAVMQVRLSPIALDQQMAERAQLMISQRQEIQAYRELYAFIGEHEEDMQSRTVLASYLLQENRMAEVGDILLNAPLERSPKLRQIKARWYAQKGEYNLALYTLNSDLPQIETYPEYYVLLAAYYQRYGSAAEAKQAYSSLVDYDETVADWWAGLGLASDRNNEKAKAIYAYQQALEIKGLSPELFNFVKPRLKQLLASNTKQ